MLEAPTDSKVPAPSNPPKRSRFRGFLLNLTVLCFGLFAALLLFELLLHIRNPFLARIKGNRIVLLTNKQYHIKNDVIPSLDPVVTVTRNSLGFRGPDPPSNFSDALTIVTIGGSTTQCFFLSDDKTWTARLGKHLEHSFRDVWINNAGLDGHSTYGHIVLLQDIVRPLHPKLIFLLVGANDVARSDNMEYDAENVRGSISFSTPTAFIKSLSAYSEVAALIANGYRSLNAYRHGLLHQYIDLKRLGYVDPSPGAEKAYFQHYTLALYLDGFGARLRRLINDARDAGIEVVLITQPLLVGAGIDDITHLDLARLDVGGNRNGRMYWDVTEAYNDVTRRVATDNRVWLVDLAHELPKSSRYFYDFIHFTNEGAQLVADITYRDICSALQQKLPHYATSPCPARR